MQHAEFPSWLRFSFTRNKLEKSRKPSSSACACLCHDWNEQSVANCCQSWYLPPREEYCFRPKEFIGKYTPRVGSFHCVSMERTQNQQGQGSLRTALSTLLSWSIVRSRNARINDPIRTSSSSNAKWPVSIRLISAPGRSLLNSSAPSTVKIPSFLPQVISMGGCCLRKYSCQSAKTSRSLFAL